MTRVKDEERIARRPMTIVEQHGAACAFPQDPIAFLVERTSGIEAELRALNQRLERIERALTAMGRSAAAWEHPEPWCR